MTITLRHHEQLELNRVEYTGSVTLAELAAIADYQAVDPKWLNYDCLNLIAPGADFHTVDLTVLDALFAKYRALYQPLKFQILRRSAWLCQSAAAQAHVDHWLCGGDTRKTMSSDVRQFDTFAEAGDWLVLSEDYVAILESGDGFAEIARFSIPAARAAAC